MLRGESILLIALLTLCNFTNLSYAAVIHLPDSLTDTTGIPTTNAPSSRVSSTTAGTNVVLSNDDGWAALNVRTFFSVLSGAPYNYNVLMSAPAENMSGRGGLDKKPKVLKKPCEFNSCPVGSPAVGVDGHNNRIHYVNSYPATAMKYGIQVLAPSAFRNTGGRPQIALAGPNFGLNTGKINLISGTVGATVAAVRLGIPGVAFSGSSKDQVSYLNPGPNSTYAEVYGQLAAKLTDELLKSWKGPAGNYGKGSILPAQTWVNVNFSPSPRASGECKDAGEFKFVLTRINEPWFWTKKDMAVCGNKGRLPNEEGLMERGSGCWASVSVGNMYKMDAGSQAQAEVYRRLKGILSCTTPGEEGLLSKAGKKVKNVLGFGP